MIRDRLKKAARKAALRAFKMEKQAEDRAPREVVEPTGEVDLSKIPTLVDGSGDTPGPNHRTRIGRTWLAAQMVAGTSPVLIDMRPPQEWTGGILPGALLLPGEQVKDQLELLPARDVRVTVYDSDGGAPSDRLASWLREAGWPTARQLQGGWAEWLEQGEARAEVPEVPGARAQVGTAVALGDGREGVVQAIQVSGQQRTFTVLLDSGAPVVVGEDLLAE